MKKYIIIMLTLLTIVVSSCEKKIIKGFYRITLTYHEGKEPTADIEALGRNKNDSIILKEQMDFVRGWYDEAIPEFLDEEIARVKKQYKDNPAMMEHRIESAYKIAEEMSNMQFILMTLTHSEDYQPKEFFKVAKKYGTDSKEMEKYIQENHLEVNYIPLN